MRIAIVGLGIMGNAMAKRLLDANHTVIVWNRSPDKTQPLVDLGAVSAGSPADAAQKSDVVISMVTDPGAVRQITFGSDGILAGLSNDALHCEMSTVSPSSAKEMAAAYAEAGKRFVQCPVLGSKTQIEQTTLIALAGGDAENIAMGQEAWSVFVGKTFLVADAEQASALKLAINTLISQMILGLGQTLVLAKQYGVDPRFVLEVLDTTALASPMYRAKGKSIVENNFNPNFVVANVLKDLNLANEAAQAVGGTFLLNDLARQIFGDAIRSGYGNEDYSAVVKEIARQNGVSLTS